MSENSKIIEVENLSVKLGSKIIIKDINFTVAKNDWFMLIGPNGAGKSTTIYALAKNVGYSGCIKLNGESILNYENTNYAQKVGFLSQKNLVAYDYSVEEIVAMGRYCHCQGLFKNLTKLDKEKINEALNITGMLDYKSRSVLELSGGEVQRTFLAQVIAQDPEVLVLDEPTNSLDIVYQSQIFDLLDQWIKEKDATIISVVHDLGLAKYYGTKAALLDHGNIYAYGNIEDVLSSKNVNSVYGMDVKAYFNKLYS